VSDDALSTHADIPTIDWSRLDELRLMEEDGMVGIATKLVKSYVENSRRRLIELQAFVSAGDAEGARRIAHSIKSTSANVGATALSALGRALEHAAELPKWQPDQADVDRIAQEYGRVEAVLAGRFDIAMD
jgi:two-component system, sensor histidine kinase and response regulator